VEIYPQSKTMISKISMKRTHQERFLRRSLELGVVEQFLQNRDETVIQKMENVLAVRHNPTGPDYYNELFSYDNKFHGIIFETANQGLSWSTINEVVSHYNRFRLLSIKMKGVSDSIREEHERILRAAEKGDAQEMRDLLEAHLGKIQHEAGSLIESYPHYFVE
jgi:DNA-binding GntR family transcriptional regulator